MIGDPGKNVDVPEGLHENQYAMYALENGIGRPATKANIELIASCIKSISKLPRLGLKGNLPKAMRYLIRAVQLANEQCVTVDYSFFADAAYLNMRPHREAGHMKTYKPMSAEEKRRLAEDQASPAYQELVREMDKLLKQICGQTKMEAK